MVKLALKDKIMAFMQRESYAPMTVEELIFAIPVKEEPMHEFWDAILDLEQDGYIVKTRFDTYGLPEKMGLVEKALAAAVGVEEDKAEADSEREETASGEKPPKEDDEAQSCCP